MKVKLTIEATHLGTYKAATAVRLEHYPFPLPVGARTAHCPTTVIIVPRYPVLNRWMVTDATCAASVVSWGKAQSSLGLLEVCRTWFFALEKT